jgi:hypothetical protein
MAQIHQDYSEGLLDNPQARLTRFSQDRKRFRSPGYVMFVITPWDALASPRLCAPSLNRLPRVVSQCDRYGKYEPAKNEHNLIEANIT